MRYDVPSVFARCAVVISSSPADMISTASSSVSQSLSCASWPPWPVNRTAEAHLTGTAKPGSPMAASWRPRAAAVDKEVTEF